MAIEVRSVVLSLLESKLLPVSSENFSYVMGTLAANLETVGYFFSYLLVSNGDG